MSGLLHRLTHRKKSTDSNQTSDQAAQHQQAVDVQQPSGRQLMQHPNEMRSGSAPLVAGNPTTVPVYAYAQKSAQYPQSQQSMQQRIEQPLSQPITGSSVATKTTTVSSLPSGATTTTSGVPPMADEVNTSRPALPPRPSGDATPSTVALHYSADTNPSTISTRVFKVPTTVVDKGLANKPSEDGYMTRSEEELHIYKERKIVEKVILRKKVKIEYVTETIPLRKEYIEIERVAVDDKEQPPSTSGNVLVETSDKELAKLAEGLVLCEERAIITKEIVPVERIKLIKKIEQYNAKIEGELCKEKIIFQQSANMPAPVLKNLDLEKNRSSNIQTGSDVNLFDKDKSYDREKNEIPRDLIEDRSI